MVLLSFFRCLHLWFGFIVQNTGDASCPREIAVLRSETLNNQLNEAVRRFVPHQIVVDKAKNTVTLPKIFDVYRNDFGGDPVQCLVYCYPFMNQDQLREAKSIDRSFLTVKFHPCADQYHQLLAEHNRAT